MRVNAAWEERDRQVSGHVRKHVEPNVYTVFNVQYMFSTHCVAAG